MTTAAEITCPGARPYHRAALINARGGVSALCFAKPRAIDLKRASWTNRDAAVTCPKCLALLAGSTEDK